MIDFSGSMPSREPIPGHFQRVLRQVARGFQCGQRVQVHDAVHAVVFLLHFDVIADRAEVIANVLAPGGSCS